ncbi:MAG: ankyrin repeat domain-containing protein [Gammaproteobacteria bacterium]|nr:ankyrin repeat domain-containing protein [Gammaproteobacteria bacterium]
MLEHKALVTLAKKLGYTDDEQGLCHGATLRCLEAYLLGEQDKFSRRIYKITQTDNLDKLIHQTQEKVKQHQPLTPDDLEHLEIRAFYDSLILYQEPYLQRDIFNNSFDQNNMTEVSQLASSEEIQKQGGLSTLYTQASVYTEKELTDYLTTLKNIILNDNIKLEHNLGMILSNRKHTIALFYQVDTKQWVFMNISAWPPFKTTLTDSNATQILAQQIMNAFSNAAYTAFNLTMLTTTAEQKKLATLKRTLNQFKVESPLTKEVAQRTINHTNLSFIAAQNNDVELIKQLAKHDVNFNQQDNDGTTSLHIAAQRGHIDVLLELIKHDVNLKQENKKGGTTIGHAAFNGHANLIAEFAKYLTPTELNQATNYGELCTCIAAEKGHVDFINELARHNVDLNQTNHQGYTAMFIAAKNGQIQVLRALIKQGVSPNQVNKNDSTPLFLAVFNNHINIIDELITHGVNLNKKNEKGYTPLHIAVVRGHLETVLKLASHGVDMNQLTDDGKTLIEVAKAKGHHHIATELEKYSNKNTTFITAKNQYTEVIANLNETKQLKRLIEALHQLQLKLLDKNGKYRTNCKEIGDTCLEVTSILVNNINLTEKCKFLDLFLKMRSQSPLSVAALDDASMTLALQQDLRAIIDTLSKQSNHANALKYATIQVNQLASRLQNDSDNEASSTPDELTPQG